MKKKEGITIARYLFALENSFLKLNHSPVGFK